MISRLHALSCEGYTYESIQACRWAESAASSAPFSVQREQCRFEAVARNGLAGYDAGCIAREESVEMVVRRSDERAEVLLQLERAALEVGASGCEWLRQWRTAEGVGSEGGRLGHAVGALRVSVPSDELQEGRVH